MYFNYHAKVQNLIKKNEVDHFEFLDCYHNISPCLLIYSKDGKSYPIRRHKFDEYLFLLNSYDIPQIKNGDWQ